MNPNGLTPQPRVTDNPEDTKGDDFSLIKSSEYDIEHTITYARGRLESRKITSRSEGFLKMYLRDAKSFKDPSTENKIALGTFTDVLYSEACWIVARR